MELQQALDTGVSQQVQVSIGVVGAGFVGSAVINALHDCQILICDPRKSDKTIAEICSFKPEAIFVCVPTPCRPDGRVDTSILDDVLSEIPENQLVILKSTVTPDYLLSLKRRIVYNPEFLTQANANMDFLASEMLILGGEDADCEKVLSLYRAHTPIRCRTFMTDIATASLVKYTMNCFLAMKVIFMNELYALHSQVAGSSWLEFVDILMADRRMGSSHMMVPGPDGSYGFGGACFPKDTSAFTAFAESIGVDLSLIRQSIAKNAMIRL